MDELRVFDFDKTITKHDNSFGFFLFCLRRYPRVAKYLPLQAWAGILYIVRAVDKTGMKTLLFRYLKDIPDVEEACEQYWQEAMKDVNYWYLLLHAEEDIVVSASPDFIVRPGCRRLGIKHVIASDVDMHTGEFRSPNCSGEEKVRRFRAAFPDGVVGEFYSDSRNDAPMARLARRSYYVTGEGPRDW